MSDSSNKTVAAETPAAEPAVVVNPNDVHLTIDGQAVVAHKGDLIIKAAEDNGIYIPRFCYHHRMNSVGMCRMCLCEVDSGRGLQVTVTCMATVSEGMVVENNSPTSKRMQEGVIEMLLANHPLDCPVCDKGGECPLQDQSMSHGPGESRFVEEKRHFEKPIPISGLVLLDRERCILCDRCTRFADEVAGDPLIHFMSRGNTTQVNTFPDEPFSSYFSGNTVQLCPVGALTAPPYRFKARPWDLTEAESTCTGCSVGCRIVVQSSRNELVRYLGVDSEPVNWSWLCDRGRFGYESTNSVDRLLDPLIRSGEDLVPTSWNAALTEAADLIKQATAAGGPASIAVLGGANGTNEDAFAWATLAHEVIGTPNVYAQFGDGLPAAVLDLPRATITDAVDARTIVLLCPDLKEELGVLYLRLRDAAVRRNSKIIEFAPKQTGMTRYAWRSVSYEPGSQAAVVREALATAEISAQLATGEVVIVAGRANLAESVDATVAALNELLAACPDAKVLPAFRRANVVGALQVGMTPGTTAEGVAGKRILGIMQDAAAGRIECLVLVGADPLGDHPDRDLTRRALAGAKRIIAIDTFLNESSGLADVVFPAAASGEKSGSHTNLEGRVSTLAQKVTPRGTARPDWMIAVELGIELGQDLGFSTVDEITAAIAATIPAYAGITTEALAATPDGIIAKPTERRGPLPVGAATASERISYNFRLIVSRKMYDQSVSTSKAPSLAVLAEAAAVHLHPLDLARVGVVEGTEVKVSSARATVVLAAVGDPGVRRGTAWVPFNLAGSNVGELIDCTAPVTDVRIENL